MLDERKTGSPFEEQNERELFLSSLIPTLVFVVFIWFVRLLEFSFDANLYRMGILPRTTEGLVGIVASPLVHGTHKGSYFSHIINNTIAIIPLMTALFYFYRPIARKVFVLLWLVIGFWVWCFARSSYHIGASGLIYGLAGFLFVMGVMARKRETLALSAIIIFTHAGMLRYVFPGEKGISWESHLMGLIAGIVIAINYRGYHKSKILPNSQSNYNFTFDQEEENSIQINYTYREKK